MDTTELARDVLRDAERSLRHLIEQALKEQRYCEVAVIADLADRVARLLDEPSPMHPARLDRAAATRKDAERPGSRPKQPKRRGRQVPKAEYPKFEREGDKLVKIGWSKAKRSTYEHRAPHEAVIACVRHLSSRVTPGKPFTVEDILPVPDVATGTEVPAYQVYLALAWLRHVGALERQGRDGYVLHKGSSLNGNINAYWAATSTRGGTA